MSLISWNNRLTFWWRLIVSEKATTKIHITGEGGLLQSPGFPDTPYPSNLSQQWLLQADPRHRVKLDFHTLILEDDCQHDFLKIYDSLVPIELCALTEWEWRPTYDSPPLPHVEQLSTWPLPLIWWKSFLRPSSSGSHCFSLISVNGLVTKQRDCILKNSQSLVNESQRTNRKRVFPLCFLW